MKFTKTLNTKEKTYGSSLMFNNTAYVHLPNIILQEIIVNEETQFDPEA